MSVPLFDLAALAPAALLAAVQQHGSVLVRDPELPAARCDQALADAQAFFAQPEAAKAALAIARSPHARGYSVMHGERDWREQVHFGREAEAVAGDEPWWRLRGPNAWPADAAWRTRLLELLHGVERLGTRVLAKLAAALGLDSGPWLGAEPYLLLKLIAYHPQPRACERRPGVAAHLDFSLVTLTLQDDVGGLEVQRPDGAWVAVPCVRGAWLVNVGELLQFVTGNRLVATPHRVVNPSAQRQRHSIPAFLHPSLATTLRRARPPLPVAPGAGAHVHAVLDPRGPGEDLHFGAAEWRRKGENVWCAACCGAAATP
jgi:isopenicillin N synthase-like dioxygenase